MKVLLVDDEEAILDVFKQALQTANFDVITALTGSQGLDITKKEHPDVIFLDQVLPDMNGNQILQQLKADPETKQIPVAILSNFNQDTLVANAMKMGAADYILKYQIAPQDLAAKATSLLQEVHKAEPSAQIAQPSNPVMQPMTPAQPSAPTPLVQSTPAGQQTTSAPQPAPMPTPAPIMPQPTAPTPQPTTVAAPNVPPAPVPTTPLTSTEPVKPEEVKPVQ